MSPQVLVDCQTFAEISVRTFVSVLTRDAVLSFRWTIIVFGIRGTAAAENDREVYPLAPVLFPVCLKDFL